MRTVESSKSVAELPGKEDHISTISLCDKGNTLY